MELESECHRVEHLQVSQTKHPNPKLLKITIKIERPGPDEQFQKYLHVQVWEDIYTHMHMHIHINNFWLVVLRPCSLVMPCKLLHVAVLICKTWDQALPEEPW